MINSVKPLILHVGRPVKRYKFITETRLTVLYMIKQPSIIIVKIIAISFPFKGSLTPTHRTKRELYPGFKEKHIIFVKEGRKITYHLLKGRLPSFADTESRTKHSYIVVFIKKKESETKKKKLFFEKLDTLVLNKIRDGKCKENLKHGKLKQILSLFCLPQALSMYFGYHL